MGNARWLGGPLAEVLDRAGVNETQSSWWAGRWTISRSASRSKLSTTAGTPCSQSDMNGEPPPMEHGFQPVWCGRPLRLRLCNKMAFSFDRAHRWGRVRRLLDSAGWAKEAPIKTQSRIDTPTQGASMPPGRRQAPVWPGAASGNLQSRGELGEEAEWVEARLAEPLSDNCWRQWVVDWEASRPEPTRSRCGPPMEKAMSRPTRSAHRLPTVLPGGTPFRSAWGRSHLIGGSDGPGEAEVALDKTIRSSHPVSGLPSSNQYQLRPVTAVPIDSESGRPVQVDERRHHPPSQIAAGGSTAARVPLRRRRPRHPGQTVARSILATRARVMPSAAIAAR